MSPDETVASYFIGDCAASEPLEALSKGIERVPHTGPHFTSTIPACQF